MRDVAQDRSGEPSAATASARPRAIFLAVAFASVAVAGFAVLGMTLASTSRAADPQASTRSTAVADAVTAADLAAVGSDGDELLMQTAAAIAPPEVPLPPEAFTAAVLPIAAAPEAQTESAAATAATRAAATATPASPVATAVAAPAPAPTVAATPPSTLPAVTTTALSVRERGLFDAMNRERIANGLPALTLSADLLPIARARSDDMVTNDYFSHYAPNGDSVYTLVSAAGLRFSAVGENLARVSGDETRSVEVAIEKLMASPPHRANILNTHFTHVAVGTVTGADGVTVFTSVFSG